MVMFLTVITNATLLNITQYFNQTMSNYLTRGQALVGLLKTNLKLVMLLLEILFFRGITDV